jgi:hypothetical protein
MSIRARAAKLPPLLLGSLLSLVLAAAFAWGRLASRSVDLAFHLQMLDAVRGGGLAPWVKDYMVVTWAYPNLSHRLAAALTWAGVGDFNALGLVACASAALAWFILLDQARRTGLVVLAAGFGLGIVNAVVLRAGFGGEVVGNFFYPQLVGEAFALLLLAPASGLLPGRRLAFAAVAAAGTAVCGCLHLVPTLHLAGAALALLGMEALRDLLQKRRLDWRLPAGMAAIAAAVVGNPYFWLMRRLSANDGGIGFGIELGLPLLAGAEIVLLVLSGLVLLLRLQPAETDGPAPRASALLAALGAAAAAAGLAQLLAYTLLGEGSPYAVKKHAFAVFTLLGFLLPLAAVELRRAARPAPSWSLWLAAAGQAVLVATLFSGPSPIDVPAADRLLAEARALRAARGEPVSNILFVSESTGALLSYIVSTAALHRRADAAANEALQTGFPLHHDTVSTVATRPGDLYDRPECREPSPSRRIVLVRADCASPRGVSFKTGGQGGGFLREGWSVPEPGGVWTDGRRAVVELPLPPQTARYRQPWLEVGGFGLVAPQSPERRVRVRVEQEPWQGFTYRQGVALYHVFALPLPADAARRGKVRIEVEVENPVSPAELGSVKDDRRLGFGLEQIRVLPRAAD